MFDSIWVNTVCIVFIPYFLLRVFLRFEVWSCLIGFEGLDFRFSLWRDILVVEWLWLLWFTMIVFIPYFVLGVCLRFGVWSCLIAFEGLDFGFSLWRDVLAVEWFWLLWFTMVCCVQCWNDFVEVELIVFLNLGCWMIMIIVVYCGLLCPMLTWFRWG